jgi:cell division topological specificity factor MinE
MSSLFSRLFGNKPKTASIAKERLQLIIAHERSDQNSKPDFLPALQQELVAVISKYVGCSIGARIGDKKLDKKSRNIIGIGMIPRGEVGIIVAAIGLSTGAMSSELYAVVVIMAVATTIIAPPLLQRAFIGKYPCGCPESPECEN